MSAPRVSRQHGRVLVLGLLLVLLAAVCGREAWSFYEARQFNRMVEAIAERNEPTSLFGAIQRPSVPGQGSGSEPDAAQHYLAAAELLVTRLEWTTATSALLRAARDGGLGDEDSRQQSAAFVRGNANALALVEQARPLEFEGFLVPRRMRFAPVGQLTRLLDAAALDRIGQGDGDGALAWVGDLVRLIETYSSDSSFNAHAQQQVLEQAALLIGQAVGHAPPSSTALDALDAVVAAKANEDNLARFLRRDRAVFIGEIWQHLRNGRPLTEAVPPASFILQPWFRHRVNRSLERFNELVRAADQPWPARLSAIEALASYDESFEANGGRRGPLGSRERAFAGGHFPDVARAVAQRLALTAAIRSMIAVELYRRSHGSLPGALSDLDDAARYTDPMNGEPLHYRRDPQSYVVYSIGGNGLDDGGDLGALNPHGVAWWLAPTDAPDWGIRISLPETESP